MLDKLLRQLLSRFAEPAEEDMAQNESISPAVTAVQEENPKLIKPKTPSDTLDLIEALFKATLEELEKQRANPSAHRWSVFDPALGLQHQTRNLALLGLADVMRGLRGLNLPTWPQEELVRVQAPDLPSLEPLVREWEREQSARPCVRADLSLHPAVSFPWNFDRMVENLMRKSPWKYDPYNHRAYVLEPLGIVMFDNGYHSGWWGILDRTAVLPARPYDLTVLVRAGLDVEEDNGQLVWVYGQERAPVHWPWWAYVIKAVKVLDDAGYQGTVFPFSPWAEEEDPC